MPLPSARGAARFNADYFKCNVQIAARGMGVGTDFFVGLPHERVQFVLRNVRVFDAHLNGNAKTTALAFADRDSTGDLRSRGVVLLLLRHEIERSPQSRQRSPQRKDAPAWPSRACPRRRVPQVRTGPI
jgi:hypothetical protein